MVGSRASASDWNTVIEGRVLRGIVLMGNLLLAVLVSRVWHWEVYTTLIIIPRESIIYYVSKCICKVFSVMSSVDSGHDQTSLHRAEIIHHNLHFKYVFEMAMQ